MNRPLAIDCQLPSVSKLPQYLSEFYLPYFFKWFPPLNFTEKNMAVSMLLLHNMGQLTIFSAFADILFLTYNFYNNCIISFGLMPPIILILDSNALLACKCQQMIPQCFNYIRLDSKSNTWAHYWLWL